MNLQGPRTLRTAGSRGVGKEMDKGLKKLESYSVPPCQEVVRLSDFPWEALHFIQSRKAWKRAIKKGLVLVNGHRGFTGDYIAGEAMIEIFQDETKAERPQIDLPLDVLYEDNHLAVINKPAGIEVSGNKKWTLQNALTGNLNRCELDDALPAPIPIHRLDYPTSGALLVGKTVSATIALNKMFEAKAIKKTYMAITIGKMPKSGELEFEVDGKSAVSHYRVLESIESERFSFLNLVELRPRTGRRHQLRKHMFELGNPILGDRDYSKGGLILKGKGLYLHAFSLEFTHSVSGSHVKVSAPIPSKFQRLFPDN